ncbi:putative Dihydrofolate reductase-like domain-containing protein [Seiridium cardinale]
MAPVELTLVLAATRNMGIGRAGGLPWTGLKKEMAYFARVTKRSPSDVTVAHTWISGTKLTHLTQAQSSGANAVIMGRKTWDSIPPKFRPLKGRLNIVISRSHPEAVEEAVNAETDPVKVNSLEKAVEYVSSGAPGKVGRVFVIGGAQIYGAALQLPEAKRILLTKVMTDFECDAFFPLKLFESQGDSKWIKSSKQELDAWAGETVPEGVQEENGTEYEFQMWEKVS